MSQTRRIGLNYLKKPSKGSKGDGVKGTHLFLTYKESHYAINGVRTL